MQIAWIISLLKEYWKPLAVAITLILTFYSGWYYRGKKEELKSYVAIEKAAVVANNVSTDYEVKKDKIEDSYNVIDTGVTYENNYSCVIPTDGLHILTKATR